MTRKALLIVGVCVLLAASVVDARAQMSMGTFKGYLTGHVGAVASGDVTNERITGGASVAVQEITGWGAEVDFGRALDVDAGPQLLDLTSYFVNASWVKPRGIIRPFGIAGAGILQTDGCLAPCPASSRTNDLGFSLGAGAYLNVTDAAAVRADVRYFFSSADHPEFHRPDNFAYWRISVGATFMWAIVP